MRPDPSLAAWLATFAYLIVLILGCMVARAHGYIVDFRFDGLNEVGDFLAGVFAPLAFFWLVIGFFQQKKELSLQINEMAQANSHHLQMIETNQTALRFEQEQIAKAEAQIAPKLVPILKQAPARPDAKHPHYTFNIIIENRGGPARDVTLQIKKQTNRTAPDGSSKIGWHTHRQMHFGDFSSNETKQELATFTGNAIDFQIFALIDFKDINGELFHSEISFLIEWTSPTTPPN